MEASAPPLEDDGTKLRIPAFVRPEKGDLSCHHEARSAYLQQCEALLSDVPVMDLNPEELRVLCEVRQVLFKGTVAQLRRRLEDLATGIIQPLEKFVAIHFEPPSLPNGYHASLVGIPHFVLQYALLPELDPLSLFSLALTCKYLHGDAMAMLQHRADKVIGRGATVMALLVYQDIATNKNYDAGRIGKAEKKYQKISQNDIEQLGGREPFTQQDYARFIVICMIDWYGSVNRCLANKIARKSEGKAVKEERTRLLESIPERMSSLEAELAARGFAVPIFRVFGRDLAAHVEAAEAPNHHLCRAWSLVSLGKMVGKVKHLALGKVENIDLRFLRNWSVSFIALANSLFLKCEKQEHHVDAMSDLLGALLSARVFSDSGFKFGNVSLAWGEELTEAMSILSEPTNNKPVCTDWERCSTRVSLGHASDIVIHVLCLSTFEVSLFSRVGTSGIRVLKTLDVLLIAKKLCRSHNNLILPTDKNRSVFFGIVQ